MEFAWDRRLWRRRSEKRPSAVHRRYDGIQRIPAVKLLRRDFPHGSVSARIISRVGAAGIAGFWLFEVRTVRKSLGKQPPVHHGSFGLPGKVIVRKLWVVVQPFLHPFILLVAFGCTGSSRLFLSRHLGRTFGTPLPTWRRPREETGRNGFAERIQFAGTESCCFPI